MEQVTSIALAIISVALVAVIVQSPNTSRVIQATGTAFTSAVKGAMGQVG